MSPVEKRSVKVPMRTDRSERCIPRDGTCRGLAYHRSGATHHPLGDPGPRPRALGRPPVPGASARRTACGREIEAAGYRVVDRGGDFLILPAHPADVVEQDGRVRYGWSGAVPSRLEEPATAVGDPGDRGGRVARIPLRRTLAGLRAHAPDGTQVVIVAAPDAALEAALTPDGPAGAHRRRRAGGGATRRRRSALLRRATPAHDRPGARSWPGWRSGADGLGRCRDAAASPRSRTPRWP